MNNFFDAVLPVAWKISTLGNLLVAILCVVRGKRRATVIGLTLAYAGGCLATVLVLTTQFFHGPAPEYVSGILSVLAIIGVILFAFLLRIAISDDDRSTPIKD